jgi:hypothetical protein
MSIDFNSWLAQGGGLVRTQTAIRASIQRARTLDKETDIVLTREDTKLPPQSVRIEYGGMVSEVDSDAGSTGLRKATIFGIQGHPELDDTDIQVWDTFVMDGAEFTVRHVNRQLIGQIQAHCEAVG